MASEDRRRKAAAQTGLYLLVIAAILVVANVISAGMYDRVDVTKNERYTLSKGSGRMISELKSPVQVDAYVTRGTAQLDAFVGDLTDLLKEYERAGGGNFTFTIIEPKSDEEKEKAKDAGLTPMAFGEASQTGGDQATIAQGYMGLVIKYGSEKAVIPQLSPAQGQGLEFWITNKIREIRDKADDIKYRIGVVTGKDELQLSDKNLIPRRGGGGAPSMESVIKQAFPFYSIETVDLKDGEEQIDPKLVGLIITQPRKAYTDKELYRIDEFLMQGNKSLVVYASAVTMKPNDATMKATLDLHNLDKLLAGYGIQMKKNAVLDFGSQVRVPVLTQSGIAAPRHPGMAHVVADPRLEGDEQLIDTSFPAFFRLEEMVFPYPSSIELLKDKQPSDVELRAVARTTPASSVIEGDSADMKLDQQWKPKPPYEQHIIAAVAEGKLKSAFAGTDTKGVKIPERAKEPSRVLVVSASQFLTNPFAYAGNGPELGGQFQMFGGVGGDQTLQAIAQPYAQRYLTLTILSLKNTLDWMSGDADLLAASAKILGEPNLTYSSIKKPEIEAEDDEEAIKKKDEEYRNKRQTVQQQIQWTLTLAVPLFFAFFGVIRWRMRENKRVNIKL